MLKIVFIPCLKLFLVINFVDNSPVSQHFGFGSSYPWTQDNSNWNPNDDWEIMNRMQANGIYVTQDCQRDPSSGTFENRFCHQDSDCCYSLDFVKSKQNPCRMECRISNLQQGSNEFFLSSFYLHLTLGNKSTEFLWASSSTAVVLYIC